LAFWWLGNARMLVHANEILHIAGVISGLALALRGVTREHFDTRAWWLMLGGASVATFSFGNGLVVFPCLIVLAIMQRRSLRAIGLLVAATALMAIIYKFLLPDRDGALVISVENVFIAAKLVLAWLNSAVFTGYLNFFSWDAAKLDWIAELTANGEWAARSLSAMVPDQDPYRFVRYVLGSIGLLMVATALLLFVRHLRRGFASHAQIYAIALMLFSLGTAFLIVLFRIDKFINQDPGQLFADRYVIWSCLWWLGFFLYALDALYRAKAWRWTIYAAPLSLLLVAWTLSLSQVAGILWASASSYYIDSRSSAWSMGLVEAADLQQISTMPRAYTLDSMRAMQKYSKAYFNDYWRVPQIADDASPVLNLLAPKEQAGALPSHPDARQLHLQLSAEVAAAHADVRMVGRNTLGEVCARMWHARPDSDEFPDYFLGSMERSALQGWNRCAGPASALSWTAVDQRQQVLRVVFSAE
jgi:hypothetical protein